MKVIEFQKYGGPEVLQIVEKQKPVPKQGEILIKIRATAVNSGDWRVRRANPFLVRLFFGLFRPKQSARVLGSVLSGVVESIGEGVTRFKVGDRVFGMSDPAMGCYAEFIVLPESAPVTKLNQKISHEEAASVPFGLHTAYHFLNKCNLQAGDRVLVIGASGAVGSAAVQIAKMNDCRVTAVTSTKNIELLKQLGADSVIDYSHDDPENITEQFDVIIECVNKTDLSTLRNLLQLNGHLVLVAAGIKDMLLAGLRSSRWKANIHTGVAEVTQKDMQLFQEWIESGTYRPVLEKTYKFEDIAEAHRYVEQGHKQGNVALQVAAS